MHCVIWLQAIWGCNPKMRASSSPQAQRTHGVHRPTLDPPQAEIDGFFAQVRLRLQPDIFVERLTSSACNLQQHPVKNKQQWPSWATEGTPKLQPPDTHGLLEPFSASDENTRDNCEPHLGESRRLAAPHLGWLGLMDVPQSDYLEIILAF